MGSAIDVSKVSSAVGHALWIISLRQGVNIIASSKDVVLNIDRSFALLVIAVETWGAPTETYVRSDQNASRQVRHRALPLYQLLNIVCVGGVTGLTSLTT